MRAFITYLGQVRLTLLITVISILISLLIVYLAITFFGVPFLKEGFILAVVIPAVIAPSISWSFLKLYFKIEHLEQEMRTIATYDSLTGLLSRKAFLDMGRLLYQEEENLSLLYLDIDNFKQINDTYGHEGGDCVLRNFGKSLREVLRQETLVGRLGGEEVAILFTGIPLEALHNITLRIQDQIEQTSILIEGNPIVFTVSIGVATRTLSHATTLEALISHADHALYIAKNHGKDCAYLATAAKEYALFVPAKNLRHHHPTHQGATPCTHSSSS